MVEYKADVKAENEVPPTNSSGKGTADVTVDTETKTLTYTVEFSALSSPATAAYIQCPADPGQDSGVRVPLPVSMSPIKGSTTMSESQLSALSNGKCYVNVHTDANKGGEIRGQLVRAR